MEQTKFDKFKNGVINSLGFIVVVIAVAIYMARSFVTIGETGKAVGQIIADGAFALLFGWSIRYLLGYQGILSGMQNKMVVATIERHGATVQKVEPWSPYLQDFCDKRNAELRIRKRRLILSKVLLHYEDVFNDDPARLQAAIEEKLASYDHDLKTIDAKDRASRRRKRKARWAKRRERARIMRCVRKANNVTFVELSQNVLSTDGGNGDNPFAFPVPFGKHMARKGVRSLFTAFLFAIIFGYYGYSIITNPSWANVIGGLIQVGAFLCSGTIQFMVEYFYATDTYRKGIVRKIDLLEQFFREAEENAGHFNVPNEIISTKKERKDGEQHETILLDDPA